MVEQVKEWHVLLQEKNKLLQTNNTEHEEQLAVKEQEITKLKSDLDSKTSTIKVVLGN